jgi:hypothetical protein
MRFPRTPVTVFLVYAFMVLAFGGLFGVRSDWLLHDVLILGTIWALIAWGIVSIPTAIRWLHSRFT